MNSRRACCRDCSGDAERGSCHAAPVDWDDLRFVLAVARAESLADAAKRLGVAHTTVSRRVAAFEAQHGVRLFDRTPAGWVLTDAGRQAVSIAERVETEIATATRALVGRDAELAGEVTLTAPEALAPKLAPLVKEFRELYPNITLRLLMTGDSISLAARDADVALRVAPSPPESLVGRKLASVAFAVYAARAEAEDRWVVLDESYAQTPQARWESANVPADAIAARASSRLVFVELVAAGVGRGLLPCGLADQDPRLWRLGAPVAALSVPLWILTPADLRELPRIRAVLDFFAARVEAERDLLSGVSIGSD